MLQRDGLEVNFAAMQDPVDDPVDIRPRANGAGRFIGQNARIVLHQAGQVVTGWVTDRGGMRYPPEPCP